jgi:hypothetical protein
MSVEGYNTILVIAGVIIAGLSFAVYKLGLSLRDMLPPEFTNILPVLLNTLTDLASRTETPDDDELVERLKELLKDKEIAAQVRSMVDGRP